jgi:DNA polymerase III delta prime subunit
LCLYNSKLLNFYYKKINSKSGKIFPQIRISSVENLPIKEISLSAQDPFVEKAHKMLSLNKDFHELVDKFLNRIQDNLKIEKLTKKLESFYELEFKDFLIELKKQKVSLSLAQQDEREPYFREYKEKILALKNEIDKTDKEIDGMVFDLYGLNEEERKVVLGG